MEQRRVLRLEQDAEMFLDILIKEVSLKGQELFGFSHTAERPPPPG
jgi:hypothetical protein